MAYQELIKDFQNTRETMRSFLVYGLKTRTGFAGKSARTYDDERRRIASWLGEYMCWRQDQDGRKVFLSVDSRQIPHNPLYQAFRACSFTDRDITLHFLLLDLLDVEEGHTSGELLDAIEDRYLADFQDPLHLDESTLRKKLKEYEALGLAVSEKAGRTVLYRRAPDTGVDLGRWRDAVSFFSEASPLGVVGSFLLQRLGNPDQPFRFKHHYILHALDSDILCTLLDAIRRHRAVELTLPSWKSDSANTQQVFPVRILWNIQTGRQYLLAVKPRESRLRAIRADNVQDVQVLEEEPRWRERKAAAEEQAQHLWGVSTNGWPALEHIACTVRVQPGQEYILQRLERERRCGKVEAVDPLTRLFTADVYGAEELIPWLRSFLGSIQSLECSNPQVERTFWNDFAALEALYGGTDHALS